MSEGRCHEYINLYRDDGVPLCSFMSVVSLVHTDSARAADDKIAIITIRSASSVGQVLFNQIGLNAVKGFTTVSREDSIARAV